MIADVLVDTSARPVIAHRGAAGLAPENTIAAFDLAVEQGADAFELDVRVTADGVPVVIHDANLERTTDRTGVVSESAFHDVRQADAGARFLLGGTAPFRGRGVHVPSLEEVLERYPAIPLLIEIKAVDASRPVRRLLERHGAATRVVVASFHEAALALFRDGPWLAGASRRTIAELAVRAWVGLPPANRGCRAFAVPRRYKGWFPVATSRFIRAAHRVGAPVHVWTIDDAAVAVGLWNRGANGMVTNDPAAVLATRNRLFPMRHPVTET